MQGSIDDARRAAERWKHLIEACDGDDLKADRLLLQQSSTAPPFDVVAQKHINSLTDVRPATVNQYLRYLDNYFEDILPLPVDAVTTEVISEWLRMMLGRGLSEKTIKNVHGFMSSVMERALYYGHIDRNPCRRSRLPKDHKAHQTDSARFLTPDEMSFFVSCVDPFFQRQVLHLVATGLRFSEQAALGKPDFQERQGIRGVSITKSWNDDGNGGRYLGRPKTPAAVRFVSTHDDIDQMVQPLVEAAGSGFVFTFKRGSPLKSAHYHNRVWRPAVEKARKGGLEKTPRPHDLRHTHASWMIAEGMDLFTLSRRLGHNKYSTTADLYGHLTPKGLIEGADLSGKVMSRFMHSVKA